METQRINQGGGGWKRLEEHWQDTESEERRGAGISKDREYKGNADRGFVYASCMRAYT